MIFPPKDTIPVFCTEFAQKDKIAKRNVTIEFSLHELDKEATLNLNR